MLEQASVQGLPLSEKQELKLLTDSPVLGGNISPVIVAKLRELFSPMSHCDVNMDGHVGGLRTPCNFWFPLKYYSTSLCLK